MEGWIGMTILGFALGYVMSKIEDAVRANRRANRPPKLIALDGKRETKGWRKGGAG